MNRADMAGEIERLELLVLKNDLTVIDAKEQTTTQITKRRADANKFRKVIMELERRVSQQEGYIQHFKDAMAPEERRDQTERRALPNEFTTYHEIKGWLGNENSEFKWWESS